MKNIFIVLILFVASGRLCAQDLIVTSEGDSINCKITSIKSDCLYFTFKHKDEIRNTLLPINKTKDYKYQYYKTLAVPAEQVGKLVYRESYPHWLFAVNAGWSYRTAKIADNLPSTYKNYLEGLMSGYNLSCEGGYFFTESLGVGLKFSVSNASNHADNLNMNLPDGTGFSGSISDDISVSYFGPCFSTRFLNASKKNAFVMNVGLGYLGYNDAMKLNGSNVTVKGSTAGFVFDIGYDFGISPNAALGIKLSLLSGSLSSVELSSGGVTKNVSLSKDEYESLNRIDLSVGLRFSSSK